MNGHVLVLGGARSGKTTYAETIAASLADRPAYLATAEARDAEMHDRIAQHRINRDPEFVTFEEPVDLIEAVEQAAIDHDVIVIDCITLWLSNLMEADADVASAIAGLCNWLEHHSTPRLVMISNEVGAGIVPVNAAARQFRDLAGTAHQRLAAVCDSVVFTIAGLPMPVKGQLPA